MPTFHCWVQVNLIGFGYSLATLGVVAGFPTPLRHDILWFLD